MFVPLWFWHRTGTLPGSALILHAAFADITIAPSNKQLQWTMMDKVPSHVRQSAAAELRRYAYLALRPEAIS